MGRLAKPRSANHRDVAIGTRLRIARIHLNLSQQEVAKALGISFQQLQKYENGSNRIAASRLAGIAKVLETTPNDLCGWENSAHLDGVKIGTYKLAKAIEDLPVNIQARARRLMEAILIDCE